MYEPIYLPTIYGLNSTTIVHLQELLFVNPGVCPPRGLLQDLVILFYAIYPLAQSVMFFLFPYLATKLFFIFCIRLLICPRAFSTYLLVEFSFVILGDPVLVVLFDSILVSLQCPFFRPYLWIYFFQLYCQSCLLLFFGLFILL